MSWRLLESGPRVSNRLSRYGVISAIAAEAPTELLAEGWPDSGKEVEASREAAVVCLLARLRRPAEARRVQNLGSGMANVQ